MDIIKNRRTFLLNREGEQESEEIKRRKVLDDLDFDNSDHSWW